MLTESIPHIPIRNRFRNEFSMESTVCERLTHRVAVNLKAGLEAMYGGVCLITIVLTPSPATAVFKVPRYTKFAVPPDNLSRVLHSYGPFFCSQVSHARKCNCLTTCETYSSMNIPQVISAPAR